MLMESGVTPLDSTFRPILKTTDTDVLKAIPQSRATNYNSIKTKRYSRSIHLPVQSTSPSTSSDSLTSVRSECELSKVMTGDSDCEEGRVPNQHNNDDTMSISGSSLTPNAGRSLSNAHAMASSTPTTPTTPTTPKSHKFFFKSPTIKTHSSIFETAMASSFDPDSHGQSLLNSPQQFRTERNRSTPSFRKLSLASAFPVFKEPAFMTTDHNSLNRKRRGSTFSAISNISKISTSNTTNALKNFVSRSLGTTVSPIDAATPHTTTVVVAENNEKNPSMNSPISTVSAPLKQSSAIAQVFSSVSQVDCIHETKPISKSSTSAHNIPLLPSALKEEISCFAIDGFAKKYFATHKRGLFRRKVPMSDMLKWSKAPLKQPLIMINKDLNKNALKCFKLIQIIMGDRSRSRHSNEIEDIQAILECGIMKGQMRDEIYVQICKQLHDNPKSESIRKGWELLCMISITFPPSKNLESYLTDFVQQHHQNEQHQLNVYSQYVSAKLVKICTKGAKGKVLTSAEIERAKEAPFKPSVFGESLGFIMQLQREKEEDACIGHSAERLQIPKIIPFLTNAIMEMHGKTSKGIFRVPGDADGVTELRVRIENDNYDTADIIDPNVPAALLKFWLRDLAEPLIPTEVYNDCIQFAEQPAKAIDIINRLPEINRRVALVTIGFLQEFAKAEVIQATLMNVNNLAMIFAPNILRCPSESLATVFENSKFEQAFLRTLINHMVVDSHICLYNDDSSKAIGLL